jgi:hypothetical protein
MSPKFVFRRILAYNKKVKQKRFTILMISNLVLQKIVITQKETLFFSKSGFVRGTPKFIVKKLIMFGSKLNKVNNLILT